MVFYHVIRAFLQVLLLLPFALFFTVIYLVGSALVEIGLALTPAIEFRNLNPIWTYRVVKSHNPNYFNKWTGKAK